MSSRVRGITMVGIRMRVKVRVEGRDGIGAEGGGES